MALIAIIQDLDVTQSDYIILFDLRDGPQILASEKAKVPRGTAFPQMVALIQQSISNAVQRLILRQTLLQPLRQTQWHATPQVDRPPEPPPEPIDTAQLERDIQLGTIEQTEITLPPPPTPTPTLQ